jgi:hypothetical protein
MRLQEMGALSGEGRARIEALAKSTKDGTTTIGAAWESVSGEFGRYSGMMEKQSKTLEGGWSNLMDTLHQGLAGLGEKGLPMFKFAVGGAIVVLGVLFDAIGNLINVVHDFWPVFVGAGIAIAAAMVPALIAMTSAALVAIPALLATGAAALVAAAPFVALAALVALLVYAWSQNFLGLQDITEAAFGAISSIIGGIGDVIRNVASFFIEVATNIVNVAAMIPGPWQESARQTAEALVNMRSDVQMWGKETVDTAGETVRFVGKEFDDGLPVVQSAAENALAPIPKEMNDAKKEAVVIARATPGAIAQSLREGRTAVGTAAGALEQAIKEAISKPKEIAALEGVLTGKALAAALNDKRPEVRAAALAYKAAVEERLFALRNGVPEIAIATGQNYATALKGKQTAVSAAAALLARSARVEMIHLRDNAKGYGYSTGKSYADGVASAGTYLGQKVSKYLEFMESKLKAYSPPGPESPLHDIDKWGESTMQAYAEGMTRGGSLVDRTIASIGSRAASAMAVSQQPAFAYAGAGGGPVNVTIQQHFGPSSVRSREDIAQIGRETATNIRLLGLTGLAPRIAGG